MTEADADKVIGRGTVIAINNTVQLAPWADVLYSCDPSWWRHYTALHKGFTGRKVGLKRPELPKGVEGIEWADSPGLGRDRVHTNNNSGYQAINYAFLHGARTIVLLGYDMQHTNGRHHWHADHPLPLGNFSIGIPGLCLPKFTALADDLRSEGIRVINCSRTTALRCFERMPIEQALSVI